jgi:CheY-like chemotaxis protein
VKILFLDDDEERHEYAATALIGHEVVHVRTADEAITRLGRELFDVAMLDHDLGGTHYAPSDASSGYAVACAIEGRAVMTPARIIVHSFNAAGARRMVAALHAANVAVAWAPFGQGSFRFAEAKP